jgi:HKD family nuclease
MVAGFTKGRNSIVSERAKHDLNAAGRMLIIVAFMLANGISLCLLPQVRLLL